MCNSAPHSPSPSALNYFRVTKRSALIARASRRPAKGKRHFLSSELCERRRPSAFERAEFWSLCGRVRYFATARVRCAKRIKQFNDDDDTADALSVCQHPTNSSASLFQLNFSPSLISLSYYRRLLTLRIVKEKFEIMSLNVVAFVFFLP